MIAFCIPDEWMLSEFIFQFPGVDAATQEENIDWQTRDLTATIKRAEDGKNTWKKVGSEQTTESAAEAKIKTFFSIT